MLKVLNFEIKGFDFNSYIWLLVLYEGVFCIYIFIFLSDFLINFWYFFYFKKLYVELF